MSDSIGSPEDQDSSTTFVRQRRDLFVISAFLLIAQIAELKPDHLSFLGMEVDVHNSTTLIYALWALWAYWLLRYSQAFMNLPKRIIRDAYETEVERQVAARLKNKEWEKMKRHVEQTPEYGGAKVFPPEIQLFRDDTSGKSNYGWNPRIRLNEREEGLPHAKVEVTNGVSLISNVFAVISLCFKKLEVTEYLFPFVFGISPALYFVYSHFFK